jgi:hypothetical protein
MFISEKLIYLQLPKTGCTHIASILAENIEGIQIKKHNILTDYQTKKKIIGSIRNPWSWYVSLWAYGCEGKGDIYKMLIEKNLSLIIKKLYKRKIGEAFYQLTKPTPTWVEAYRDPNDPLCFQKWLKNVYEPKNRIYFPKKYYEYNLSKFAGYYTHRYALLHLKNYYKKEARKQISNYDDLFNYYQDNYFLDYIIRTESLETDLIKILKLCGYESLEIEKRILETQGTKTNPSKHKETGFYYNEETIQMVAEKERLIIDEYGYEPPILT